VKFTGKLLEVVRDWKTNQCNIRFSINEQAALYELDKLQSCEKLVVEAKKYRKHRSLNANAMLWACLEEMAGALRTDKWDVYLMMLRQYGKHTYVCVKPDVVEAVKKQWRETEEIGNIEINGQKAVQLLCYFGSSTYDTAEFSRLLDGVVCEMEQLGLQPPLSEDMKRALEIWEKEHEVDHTKG
jgi:hypothetical protein